MFHTVHCRCTLPFSETVGWIQSFQIVLFVERVKTGLSLLKSEKCFKCRPNSNDRLRNRNLPRRDMRVEFVGCLLGTVHPSR